MRYGKRSPLKRFLTSPFVSVLAVIILILLARGAWNISQTSHLSEQRLLQAQTELAKLKDRKSELTTKVDRLSSNEGFESEIRSRFPAVREGESVAVIIDEPITAAAANSASSTLANKGWFRNMLAFFGF